MQDKLKKVAPYILPTLAVIFVIVMFFRWYQGKTADKPEGGLLSQELQVSNLSQEQEEGIIKGTADYDTVEMMAVGEASGEIRYQMIDDKLNFTVTANLPDTNEAYAVWLKEIDGEARKKVFILDYSKAGYIGSASVPAEVLPVEVVVTGESDLLLEDAVLRGSLEK